MIAGPILAALAIGRAVKKRKEQKEKEKEEEMRRQQLESIGLPPDSERYTSYYANAPSFNSGVPAQTVPEQHPYLEMDYYDPEMEEKITGKKKETKKGTKNKWGKNKRKSQEMFGRGLPRLDPRILEQLKKYNNVRPIWKPPRNLNDILAKEGGGKKVRRIRKTFY